MAKATTKAVRFQVNGASKSVGAQPARQLLWVLRDELHLTGAKYGCGEGQCGACTVLIDGRGARSCVTNLDDVAGKSITTIEGLSHGETLHPLQTAFIESGAMQCGYCVPGMIVAALGLLKKNPDPSEAEIRSGLRGNLCRCGTYPRIVQAVKKAAAALRAGGGR
jgi:aerobic-type carbon monoxide dehydrogenase small subunit (CoxS/CutS family)